MTLSSLLKMVGLIGLLSIGSFSCKSKSTTAAAPASKPDDVVARYNGKTITLSQLDEKLATKLYELRKGELENMVMQDLVEVETKKKGVTQEQLFQSMMGDMKPSEQEVTAFFEDAVKPRQPDAKLEQVRAQIEQHLGQQVQRKKIMAFTDELKKAAKVEISLSPPRTKVEAKGPARGPENAPITLIEFSDFECPYCSKAHDTVEQVMQAYAGKIRLVFRHFPLDFHKDAPKAAEGSLCAHDQGKFWEFHDELFKNQRALGVPQMKDYAKALGLNVETFSACLESGKHAATVKADMEDGKKAGVSGTPGFFINGIFLNGAQPLEQFKAAIDAELASKS